MKGSLSNVFSKLQESYRSNLNWFLDVRSYALESEGEHRVEAFAQHLSTCFNALEAMEDKNWAKQSNPHSLYKISSLDPEKYFSQNPKYLEPILQILEIVNPRLSSHLLSFCLQGSMATGDYSLGWSDVDTFVVLRDESLREPKNLLEIRGLCRQIWQCIEKICPVQHHGLILYSELDLRHYRPSYIPPVVLEHAVELLKGTTQLSLHAIPSSGEGSLKHLQYRKKLLAEALECGEFRDHPKNGKYLQSDFRNANASMYQMFYFLNLILLVPALFLDAIGKPCYKKFSFERARPYFSDESWSLVELASSIRADWKNYPQPTDEAIPSWVIERIGANYFSRAHTLLSEASAKALELVEKNR